MIKLLILDELTEKEQIFRRPKSFIIFVGYRENFFLHK